MSRGPSDKKASAKSTPPLGTHLVASDLAIKKYELEAISSIVEDGKLAIYFYTFRIQVCLMKNHELLSKITLC